MSVSPLPRCLGLGPLIALAVGVVVGSGIFVLPAYVATQLPTPLAFLSVWQLGAVLALCSALSYAELATLFPSTGGYVVYLREIFGTRMAFVYGWAAIFVLYPSSIGGLARVSGRSLAQLLGLQDELVTLLSLGVVILATGINLVRATSSTRFTAALSGIKLASLLVLAIVGLLAASGTGWLHHLSSLGTGSSSGAPAGADSLADAAAPGLKAWFLGLVGVLWCYEGFLEIVVVAGEVRRPSRTLIRALVLSVLLIAFVYGGYTLALLLNLGLPTLSASPTVAADLAHVLMGGSASALMNALIFLATFSAAQALLFSGPRLLVGLAEGGVISPAVGRLSSKRQIPSTAVLILGIVAFLYALVGKFEELVKYFAFATGIFSSLILLGGMWLRTRGRVPREARRIPLWPLPSILALVAAMGSSYWVLRDQPRSSFVGLALMLLSWPLWRLLGRRGGSTPDSTI